MASTIEPIESMGQEGKKHWVDAGLTAAFMKTILQRFY
jgi:hypothetical protein